VLWAGFPGGATRQRAWGDHIDGNETAQCHLPQSHLLARHRAVQRPITCVCQPKTVIRYLGRYTKKGMLNESRLQAINKDNVTFSYKDYADDNRHNLNRPPIII
jgi:hypothetical protein